MKSWLALFGACVPLGLGLLAGPSGQPLDPGGAAPSPGLTVVFTGELNGNLTPCGCSKPMLGGMPRRAGYLRSLPPALLPLKLENGDLTEAAGRQDELKAEAVAEMLDSLQYDALNLGEKDFRLGVLYLQALQPRFGGALLCANVRKQDGGALFPEYVVLRREVVGRPVRIAVVGALSERFRGVVQSANPEVRMEAPAQSLRRVHERLKTAADVYILLFHGPAAEAEALRREFPLFHLIVCAHEGDHPRDARPAGSATLASSGQNGKHVGKATLTPEGGWRVSRVESVPLTPDWPDDPRILQAKASYLDRVAAENLLAAVARGPTPNGDRFAGTRSCRGCHAAPHRVWEGSTHARALRTLTEVKHDRDPECVGCHVVGLELDSGYQSLPQTPELANVGCESCHGPAAQHAADPKVHLPKAGAASCAGCHVPGHSPQFEFASYWQKIRH